MLLKQIRKDHKLDLSELCNVEKTTEACPVSVKVFILTLHSYM